MSSICADCPATLGPRNRSGRCRSCLAKQLNSDPAIATRRRQGIARKFEEPEFRAAHIARLAHANATKAEELRESRRQHGKRRAAALVEASRNMGPASRAKAGRARTETVLAWCPPEWRDRYRELKKRGRRAAEAKRIVLDLIAGRPAPVLYAQQKAKLAWCPPLRKDEYRRLQKSLGSAEARRIIEADLSPFERQLARVAAGARVVDKPVLRRADHDFSLVGNATGML